MTTEAKIAALKGAAERKRQDALKRTNQAITKLVKAGRKITFAAVAEAAGVSVAYLYKYDALKERIAHLKAQQEGISKPINPQTASDKSKQVIMAQLRERIKRLEAENQGLRQQHEAIYGRLCQLQTVQEQAETLKLQNTNLKAENDCLQQQLAQSRSGNENATSFLAVTTTQTIPAQGREIARSEVTAPVQAALAKVRLQLNPTLSKTIQTAPEATVLKAIDALQEAMATGTIERPGGWLKRAIEECWQPNNSLQQQVENTPDKAFNQWFDLARSKGLVVASIRGEDGQIYVFDLRGACYLFTEMFAKYPLEQFS